MSKMVPKGRITYFAPAERIPRERVMEQSRFLKKLRDLQQIFDTLSHITLVLNKQRQVVFANQAFLDLLGLEGFDSVLGARLGEILHCIHADETAGGCGTAETCGTCGAVKAIIESLKGRKFSEECRIAIKQGNNIECLDFKVSGTPLRMEGDDFTIISLADISHEKRRRALERIFFHDIINTADSLCSIVELMGYMEEPEKIKELVRDMGRVTRILMEQILEQRDLASAENNELAVKKMPVQSGEVLKELVAQFNNHQLSWGRRQRIHEDSENIVFVTDSLLLKRVLGNMIKNALEATQPGDTVTLGVNKKEDQVHFWVHNPTVISREIQLQIFKRSFSTKGQGRGLGTYSMKLLTERYLKGTVSFTVTKEQGTTFYASYPLYLMD
ncbi:ATP-binding protein [Desulforamulus ruminis]|uniref:ATP-binding region ATPase domain protein n=1 Tax=Desulforamulus ruminis (strain ATCC 23193 / DSM 2154 / NCIMB 8452 / DL) TaxID=696281 RepID=F6DS83_DESRL|nr:ATP-binding protein [Desulforamulus ruminis]AEG58845.1 ATP-binding region ATPase domain protein [Desulforamulus ruminis DSM 2154]